MASGLTVPTFASGTTSADLVFSALVDTFIADELFFGLGEYTAAEIGTKYATKNAIATELGSYLKQIGELAEKPGKVDSKIEKHKTRNYLIPGKRSSSIELTINGISAKQKDYLESSLFQGALVTMVALNKDHDRVTIFNGMRWVVEWSGEADGLWSVVLSTEFSGATANRIGALKGIS
jgi:hypothetical protein